MRGRTKLIAIVVPLAVTSMASVMLAWLLTAGSASAATCDVPSVAHTTIQSAVDDAGCDTVNLTGAIYMENITVTRSVTIQGQGALNTTVDGNASGSVFTIQSGVLVTLTKMTVTNGEASYGGGVINSGTLVISNTILSRNSATIDGGGIYNSSPGPLTIIKSAVISNTVGYGGAGIQNIGGAIFVSGSTFSSNSAGITDGGGIYTEGGTVEIGSSTFNGNSARSGGGIANAGGTVNIANSIIAYSPNGGDCSGTVVSLGYNLDSDDSCGLTAAGDITIANPLLGPLQDNGGQTFTHALQVGSVVINAGNPNGCTDHLGNPLPTDQRGMPRVGRCDVGAYEYQGIIHKAFLPAALNDVCFDYADDFSNSGSGWPVGDNGNVRFEYLTDEYRMLVRNAFWVAAARPGYRATDFTVTVDVRNATGSYGTYGLMFRLADDWSQSYTFEIDPLGNYDVWRYNSTGWTLLKTGSSSYIYQGTATNRIEVQHIGGGMYELSVNGHWIHSVYAGFAGSGHVGLIATTYNQPNLDVRFDNFSVDEATCSSSIGANRLHAMPDGATPVIDLPSHNAFVSVNSRKE